MFLDSTICAIASPAGEGAIAIIRLSGNDSFSIVGKIFSSKNNHNLGKLPSHKMIYGYIKDNHQILDEVLLAIYKKPHSYTGEDAVEIFCHGAPYIQKRIIELLIKNGAKQSREGEFTLRAFLNGKIDLTQAEAVNDLIQSKTKLANNIALKQLKGTFSHEIETIRKRLIDFVSLIELELDFGEEDVTFANRNDLLKTVEDILSYIEKLIGSFTLGNAIKNGISTAIIGEPNVGKSTLLNLILRENKAIVSEIPGTTRDVIEDTINIGGVLFRFMDTAGIRNTSDTIEKLGIERTYQAIHKAGLVLLMLDAADKTTEMLKTIKTVSKQLNSETKFLVIINKIDKLSNNALAEKKQFWEQQPYETLFITAKNQTILPALEEKILTITGIQSYNYEQVLVTNTRHYEALTRTQEALRRVQIGIQSKTPEDLLTQDIKQALYHLGEISGEIAPDDILHNIFDNFCIGK